MIRALTGLHRRVAIAAVLSSAATSLACQCGFDWRPGAGAPGPFATGNVYTVATLANGDIVVGGSFQLADSAIVNNIARWDGSTWHALGAGVDGFVFCLLPLANGDLVAGGRFLHAGGVVVNRIAKWDGSTWTALGAGFANDVNCLLEEPNGDVLAAGLLTYGTPINRVARWNGTSWSAIGTSGITAAPSSLARLPNGTLIVASSVGLHQQTTSTGWSAIPGLTGSVSDLQVMPNGDLIVCGTLTVGSTSLNLVRWDGVTFQPFAGPPSASVGQLSITATGELLAGGTLSGLGFVARLNGSVWIVSGPAPLTYLYRLEPTSTGGVVAVGITSTPISPVVEWNGSTWNHLGAPTPIATRAVAKGRNGDAFVGGSFTSIGGTPANNIARWNGSSWSALGSGVNGTVRGITVVANGDVLVCGDFTTAGGAPASHIARWNGFSWSTLGTGLLNAATGIAQTTNGDVYTIGGMGTLLAHFDGVAWTAIQVPVGANSTLHAISGRPDGSLLLGGAFWGTLGLIRYEAGIFFTLPGSPYAVYRMIAGDDGVVTTLGTALLGGLHVVQWDGATTFTNLGPLVGIFMLGDNDLAQLPNGDVLLLGRTTSIGGVDVNGLARWDGTTWSPVAGGPIAPTMSGTAVTDDGTLFVVGGVNTVGGEVSVNFAIGDANCVATATVFGSGCTGGAGSLALQAHNRPWAGGTFTSTATGFTSLSIGLHAIGVQPVVAPLPGGSSGCSLFVLPLLTDVLLPVAGEATASLPIPSNVSLAGITLRTQVVGLELDATLGVVRITSTNALDLTVGAF